MTRQRLPPPHERFTGPDGTPNRFVHAWMRGIEQLIDAGVMTTAEAADLTARVVALEALRIHGTGGITVSGTASAGFRVHLNSADTDVLASQIFGG